MAVTGTISPDGTLALTGLDGLGVLTIQARIATLDPSEFVPCILVGRFQLRSPGGSVQGDLTAVHQVPAARAPSIGGDWEGVMVQDVGERPVRASFAQSETGALTGRITLDPPDSDRRVTFDLVGQAAWDDPDIMPAYSLVAAGDDGTLVLMALRGGSIEDPDMRGPVRLLLADGSVHEATIELTRDR